MNACVECVYVCVKQSVNADVYSVRVHVQDTYEHGHSHATHTNSNALIKTEDDKEDVNELVCACTCAHSHTTHTNRNALIKTGD